MWHTQRTYTGWILLSNIALCDPNCVCWYSIWKITNTHMATSILSFWTLSNVIFDDVKSGASSSLKCLSLSINCYSQSGHDEEYWKWWRFTENLDLIKTPNLTIAPQICEWAYDSVSTKCTVAASPPCQLQLLNYSQVVPSKAAAVPI